MFDAFFRKKYAAIRKNEEETPKQQAIEALTTGVFEDTLQTVLSVMFVIMRREDSCFTNIKNELSNALWISLLTSIAIKSIFLMQQIWKVVTNYNNREYFIMRWITPLTASFLCVMIICVVAIDLPSGGNAFHNIVFNIVFALLFMFLFLSLFIFCKQRH